MKSAGSLLRDVVEILVTALVIALVIRTFIVEVTQVPSPSMVPTVEVGARLLTDKIIWRITGLKDGDVVVFDPPKPSPYPFVKRLIGLPGDRIEVRNGHVYRNGQQLNEPYIAQAPAYTRPPVTVPPGKMLMLGDNRNNSDDSTQWGLPGQPWAFADLSKVKGRVVWVLWPLSSFGAIAH